MRANTINQHLHSDTPPRGTHQGIGNISARAKDIEQIGFHLHPGDCTVDGFNQRGEVGKTTLEQTQVFSDVC